MSTLEGYEDRAVHSAMARAVSCPSGIATQLVLDGVHAPYSKGICDLIREVLGRAVGLLERVL